MFKRQVEKAYQVLANKDEFVKAMESKIDEEYVPQFNIQILYLSFKTITNKCMNNKYIFTSLLQ